MSHRFRGSRVRQHLHCDSCYSRRCRARVEPSASCALVPCRLLCGAVFHLCKEEDHLLLCPNVRVPCLNAEYGCPVQLPRSSRAAHLQVCPASVVCCSMEWLRWPVDDTNPNNFNAMQDNMMKERETHGEALDVAMALVDQSDLYARLKMKPLYPELMEQEEEENIKDESREEIAVGGVQDQNPSEALPVSSMSENHAAEETAQSVTQPPVINIEKYNLFEMMFSMERGACAVAQENLENQKQKLANEGRSQKAPEQERQDTTSPRSCPPPDTSKTGLAPWQEGVLERLGQELTPQEYNMYMVHHGRMLLAFGQIEACTSREKDFVYGSLEPIAVQTLHSFKVPVSYRHKRRVHLNETAARVQTEHRSVDTSDLGASEEDWFVDEAEATLLGYAEMAVMGHKISETKGADGLYVDFGTQTHSFHTSPFKQRTTLAEVMADRPLKLLLQLQAETVNSRNNRASCAFTFLCGHSFHRREFATHFRNVHSDIQMCLSEWFEQQCPLAYLGCTYRQRRFHPSTQKATVTYNQQLRCFNLRPDVLPSLDGKAGDGEDRLSSLPYEVLCHMASFLDSQSLSQLALVSRLMRQVCSSLLQDRGMVTLRWERTSSSHGRAKWKSKPVWEFSHLFSAVDSWNMADIPPISAHLKVCPFYQKTEQKERVALPFITEKQQKSPKGQSLLNHFTGQR
ncbi:F-box only protein 40-like [Xiphophorus hellerii]|uniref:F-box only protein 40-like n=1 Tax=Xiphophorus hellerii TaxID=8084 RepID=UPI0013B402CD|nr:F-box only protein 40-like [Xiphophorus hellerii]